MRHKRTIPVEDFMQTKGVYEKQLHTMAFHKAHVKLLGKAHVNTLKKTEASKSKDSLYV